MRTIASLTLAAWIGLIPAVAAPKAKPPTAAQLQAQVRKLTKEKGELQERLAATEDLQQDLASAEKSRDLARQETESFRMELAAIKASLDENRSGADAVLQDLQQARSDLAACTAENESLKKSLEEAKAKTADSADLPDITPARALNLNRVTPNFRNVSRGVVVVNVLISESGDVLDTRMLQALPGNDIYVQRANQACLEAAKRIVFDPARAADGKTKVRTWQAVGLLVD